MNTIDLTVTREIDIKSLYNDLMYALPECDALEEAGITEDDLDNDVVCKLLKALAVYAEEQAGE